MQPVQHLPIHRQGWISTALFMSLGMAMWAIIENISRYFDQHYTSYEIVWLRYSVHLVFMIVLSVILPFYWVTPTAKDFLLFIAIGLIGYLAIYGIDRSVEGAPTWVAAAFAFTQPLFVLAIDWILHGFHSGPSALVGALIMVLSISVFLYLLRSNWQSQIVLSNHRNENL